MKVLVLLCCLGLACCENFFFSYEYRLAKDVLLREHNRFRCLHGNPPLTWDEQLAVEAQRYADQLGTQFNCSNFVHSSASFYTTGARGENIVLGTPYNTPSSYHVLRGFYHEPYTYNWGPGWGNALNPWGSFNHFTAAMWRASSLLGCGYTQCYNPSSPINNFRSQVWVCHYKAAGNNGNYPTNIPAPVKTPEQCGVFWTNTTYASHCPVGATVTYNGCRTVSCTTSSGTRTSRVRDDVVCSDPSTGKTGICHKGNCDTTRNHSPAFSVCNPNPCENDGICDPAAADPLQISLWQPMRPRICRCRVGFTGYLCENEVPSALPPTTDCDAIADNVCYKNMTTLGAVTWSAAKQACNAWGGDLPVLKAPWQTDLLFDIFDPPRVNLQIWLGLSDSISENTWIWNDGTVFNLKSTTYPFGWLWTYLNNVGLVTPGLSTDPNNNLDYAALNCKEWWQGSVMHCGLQNRGPTNLHPVICVKPLSTQTFSAQDTTTTSETNSQGEETEKETESDQEDNWKPIAIGAVCVASIAMVGLIALTIVLLTQRKRMESF